MQHDMNLIYNRNDPTNRTNRMHLRAASIIGVILKECVKRAIVINAVLDIVHPITYTKTQNSQV